MNETMNQDTQQQTQQDPTPGAKGGRTFTQEDVNRIVSERLAHERERLQAGAKDNEREQVLKAREARLDCREYLDAQGYPAALLDVLDSSDTDRFKGAVDKLVKAFPAITGKAHGPARHFEGWRPGEGGRTNAGGPDPIAAAFKPKI